MFLTIARSDSVLLCAVACRDANNVVVAVESCRLHLLVGWERIAALNQLPRATPPMPELSHLPGTPNLSRRRDEGRRDNMLEDNEPPSSVLCCRS